MIWSPPEKPYYILDYYNILAEAVNERADFFALSGTVLEAKATPLTAPLTNLTWHFENLKKAVYTLLIHSLDARQIGGWVDFSPFPKFFDSEEENISALLEYYALPPETWFWQYPCVVGLKSDFFRFCYYLLNEIILYPEITFEPAPAAPGSWFGIDSSWEAVDLDDGFQETGRVSVDGLCSRIYPGHKCGYDGAYYRGSYRYGYSKFFSGELQVLNQSPFKFTGKWQLRYRWELSDSRVYFSTVPEEERERFYDFSQWETLQMNGDASEMLQPPQVREWKEQIRLLPKDAEENKLPYYDRFAYAKPQFELKAQLTAENFPALCYKYME